MMKGPVGGPRVTISLRMSVAHLVKAWFDVRPDAHIPTPVFFEERFYHDATANGDCGADEEGDQATTGCHRCVTVAYSTPNVADGREQCGQEPNRPPPVSVGYRFPEKGRVTKHSDLHRSQIRRSLQGAAEIFCYGFKSWNDTGGSEGRHHGVEGDEEEVGIFLPGK